MPRATGRHALAFHENNEIFLGVGGAQSSELHVQMIKRNVKDALHLTRVEVELRLRRARRIIS